MILEQKSKWFLGQMYTFISSSSSVTIIVRLAEQGARNPCETPSPVLTQHSNRSPEAICSPSDGRTLACGNCRRPLQL